MGRALAAARPAGAARLSRWRGEHPKLTGRVEENIAETSTPYRLPRQHHGHPTGTGMPERPDEEIKRRAQVGRIFPNGESRWRLARALAVEMHENWRGRHRHPNTAGLREHKTEQLGPAARMPGGNAARSPRGQPHQRP